MEKTKKLLLGGQDRTLNFGVGGFLDFLGDAMNADPLDLFSGGFATDPKKSFKVTAGIVYAGLRADYEMRDAQPDFTLEDVSKWVRKIDLEVLAEMDLIFFALSALTGKPMEELKNAVTQAATQNGQELVTG